MIAKPKGNCLRKNMVQPFFAFLALLLNPQNHMLYNDFESARRPKSAPSRGGACSSSRDEYYLGGTIALLLQNHRTMSTTGSL